jgi:hypothetical protein
MMGMARLPGAAPEGAVGAGGAKLTQPEMLPMDEASRLARAKDMGFRMDMPLYHGSGEDFSSFRAVPTTAKGMETPGVSAALDPAVANEFALASGQASPQTYQLFHRAEKPAVLKLDGTESHGEVVATLRDAFDAGHDAVMLKNHTTPAGETGKNIIIVRDANQLRSPHAAFDPTKRDSRNLLATGALGTPGLGAMGSGSFGSLAPDVP